MADRSKIEWTDATWNPIRARRRDTGKLGWHCTHVSEGCRHCYAESINHRLGTGLAYLPGKAEMLNIFLDEKMLLAPLRWHRPRKIFVGSMTDLFADFVTDEMLDRVFALAALTPDHTYQMLTKRPARARAYIESTAQARCDGRGEAVIELAGKHHPDPDSINLESFGWPLPNVWLGVSVEDQTTADARIPDLLATPAAIRFLSCEPLLGPLEIGRWLKIGWQCSYCRAYFRIYKPDCPDCGGVGGLTGSHKFNPPRGQFGPGIDWVIAGGESGPQARPMHPDWPRALRDQCATAGARFFFKQWGEYRPPLHAYENEHIFLDPPVNLVRTGKKNAGRLLDGTEHNGFPPSPDGYGAASPATLQRVIPAKAGTHPPRVRAAGGTFK